MKVFTLTTSLEMTHPDQARLDLTPVLDLEIVPASRSDANTITTFYQTLAKENLWTERTGWVAADFEMQIAKERAKIWLAKLNGTPVGFVETYHYQDNRIQIIYLGILSRYRNLGIGRHLVSYVIDTVWKSRPKKIELCTRTYDSEHALKNYLKRGFHITKVRPQIIEVPPDMQVHIAEMVADAQKRGAYPSFARRVEAILRACWLGHAARWLLDNVKRRVDIVKANA